MGCVAVWTGEDKGATLGKGKDGEDEREEHHCLFYGCGAVTNYESRRKSSAGGEAVFQSSRSWVLSSMLKVASIVSCCFCPVQGRGSWLQVLVSLQHRLEGKTIPHTYQIHTIH